MVTLPTAPAMSATIISAPSSSVQAVADRADTTIPPLAPTPQQRRAVATTMAQDAITAIKKEGESLLFFHKRLLIF